MARQKEIKKISLILSRFLRGKGKSFNFASRLTEKIAGIPATQAIGKVLTRGVTGNTSDFGSEESRFEPWRVNTNKGRLSCMTTV